LKAIEMKLFLWNESDVMKILRFVLALMTLANMQLANAVSPGVPDAGLILQQVQPSTAVVPFSIAPRAIQKPEVPQPIASSAETIFLQQIVVTGSTLIDVRTMHLLVDDAVGQRLSLAQVYELAGRITGYYQTHGYPLSRAIIPEQTIQHGVLRIQVIEARYGKISQNNLSRASDTLLRATAQNLQSGELIQDSQLDRTLLLLSDIPGVAINPTLSRGLVESTSDLLLTITPTAAVVGDVGVDNHGNRYTGQNNLRGNLNVYNPLHFGDVFTLNALSSGVGMNYGRLAYESVINGSGARLGIAASSLQYKLGGALANIDASGSANITSLWAKQMLTRSRNSSIYAQLQVDHTQLQDHIDSGATPIHNDRNIQSTTANLYGDFHDFFWHSSVSTWSLGTTQGRVQFDNAAALINDMSTSKTVGNFTKVNFNLLRKESLSAFSVLHLALNAQKSKNNLDAGQKMNAGGPYSVRAYSPGTLTGDSGYFVSAEYRTALGSAWQSQWRSMIFMDAARLTINQSTSGAVASSLMLKGTGIGLLWGTSRQWQGSTYLARPVGNSSASTESNKFTRLAIEAKKSF
jgi:hemolysin activation/secretion protein